MPCSDVTELLTIDLDTDDRIRSYSLTKKTCGGTMGRDSLILKMINGKQAEELIATPIEVFYRDIRFSSDLKEMVYSKHYLAVQAGLAEFLGLPGRASRGACDLESVEYGPEGSAITARVRVALATSEITSCGTCASCRPRGPA
jgi:hypothetical protein